MEFMDSNMIQINLGDFKVHLAYDTGKLTTTRAERDCVIRLEIRDKTEGLVNRVEFKLK